MKCEKVQKNLMGYVAGDLSQSQQLDFQEHLTQCSVCAEEAREFRLVWNSLDTWADKSIPKKVEQRILSAAQETLNTDQEWLWAFNWDVLEKLLKPLAPVAMGLLAALVSAGIVSSKMNLSLIHPLGLTAVGALWTGLYAIIFFFLLGGDKREATSWRSFAQASLVAVGIFLIFTFISPMPSSVSFCRYYSITQPVIERLSIGGSFFLFGALYALIPMGIAAYLSGSRTGNHPMARGSMAGVMFVALLVPGIYLQCAPFALGVLLVWFGGALLGSIMGGALGYWIRYRFAGS